MRSSRPPRFAGRRLNAGVGPHESMNEGQLRDQLAVERTHLANERTLLAYIRTALALAACGAALLHFFPVHAALTVVSWLLMAGGGAMLAAGIYRFFVVRGQLNE